MAKAGSEATTAWIRYSRVMELASSYLGNPEFVEREIRKGLAAGEIPWQCVRFETPPQYSGPGRGDPKFWKFDLDDICTHHGPMVVVFRLRNVEIKGDSAIHINGAAAYGLALGRGALVRLGLLPPDDVDGGPRVASSAPQKKRKWTQTDRVLRALPVLYPNGTDGIPTKVILNKVAKYLQPETELLGLSVPSWDSVNRALRQYRAR